MNEKRKLPAPEVTRARRKRKNIFMIRQVREKTVNRDRMGDRISMARRETQEKRKPC